MPIFSKSLLLTLSFCALSALAKTELRTNALDYKKETLLSYSQLIELVQKNDVRTIDQLVPLLPDQMLKNPMLVYNSHALVLNRVTPAKPRMILFNQDASLILALTQNPGASAIEQRDDHLEMITFDKDKSLYEMRDVPFDGKPDPLARALPVNQTLCLACHGQNPRPIFQDYNGWPGFYGSFGQEGTAKKGTLEYAYFSDFLKNRPALDRYKDLDMTASVYESQYGLALKSYNFGPLNERLHFTPLLAFGASTEYLMLQRLAKKIESLGAISKKYAHLISAIGQGDRCSPHRENIKYFYNLWMSEPENKMRAQGLADKIADSIKNDFLIKKNEFTQFNDVVLDLDARGLIDLPHEVLFMPPVYGVPDREAFLDELVMIESLARDWGLSNEDFSTVPNQNTGIFHVRSALGRVDTPSPLLEDEQLIKGVYDSLVQMNSPLIKDAGLACEDLRSKAEVEIKQLLLPSANQSGVLYR